MANRLQAGFYLLSQPVLPWRPWQSEMWNPRQRALLDEQRQLA